MKGKGKIKQLNADGTITPFQYKIGKYVPGMGNPSAKLLILGEAPGQHEEEQEKPFIGPSGQIVDSMLLKAGVHRSEVYATNVVKIRPPGNEINRLKELGKSIDDFLPQLFEEIRTINPNCILALGDTALKALTGKHGISKYRGSILLSSVTGIKTVPSIHPAYLLHGGDDGDEGKSFKYSTRVFMQLDFNRAVEESKTRGFNPPIRHIQIIKDAYSFYKFLDQYKDHKKFALDIETMKSIPVCIAIAPSPSHAISVQLLNIPEAGYIIPSHELAEIYRLLTEFLESDKQWIGQNWKFDQQKLETVYGIRMKDPYADTMLLQAIINPEFPKSLGFLASVYSREPFYKDEGREFVLGKDSIDQLFIYNAKDACVTFEVFQSLYSDLEEYKLESFFFDYYMKLHRFYMDLEATGLKVDEDKWKELYNKYQTNWKTQQARLQEIAGYDINCASPKQVHQYMLRDLALPLRDSTNEESLVALLGNHCKNEKQRESLSLILEIRRIRKTIGTYLSAIPDGDGRLRTSYRIAGTETGRSSTSKCDPPVRPIKGFGLPLQVLTKHGNIGADIGEIFVADKGYVFLECDLSQAEARVVALLADDQELLTLFDTSDIHTLTASWIFGCKPERNKENVTEDKRFIGKTVRHAGNYGMGKRRLMLDTNATARKLSIPIILSEAEAGKILAIFHNRTPRIRNVFQAATQFYLRENNRVLINAFGRRRQFFDRWGDSLFREAYAFTPSSSVKDHLSQAGLRIKDRIPDLRFVVESHDAFKCLVKESEIDQVAKIFKEEFEKPLDFSQCSIKRGSIKIPAEIKIGHNYKDLKEYKIS